MEWRSHIDPHKGSQKVFDKGAKAIYGAKIIFQQMMLKQLYIPMEKN